MKDLRVKLLLPTDQEVRGANLFGFIGLSKGLFILFFVISTLASGQSIQVISENSEPIPFVEVRCGSYLSYSNEKGFIDCTDFKDSIVYFHALGFTNARFSLRELQFRNEVQLIRQNEYLRQVDVFAAPVNIHSLIEEVLVNSWERYKEWYETPISFSLNTEISLDSTIYTARVESGVLQYYSNRDWFPLKKLYGENFVLDLDSNAQDLEKYVRFAPSRYLEYHFPLNPIEPPLNKLEHSRIEVMAVTDSIEIVRVISDTSESSVYEVFLTFDVVNKLICGYEKRLISFPDEKPVYGRDSLKYLAPFGLYVKYGFGILEGKYLLTSLYLEKEERIENINSQEIVFCGAKMVLNVNGISREADLDKLRNVDIVYGFPTSYKLSRWIQGNDKLN